MYIASTPFEIDVVGTLRPRGASQTVSCSRTERIGMSSPAPSASARAQGPAALTTMPAGTVPSSVSTPVMRVLSPTRRRAGVRGRQSPPRARNAPT